MDFEEIYFTGQGGITLYARDYKPKRELGLPVFCLHGLTRNSKDFEPLIEALPKTLGVRFIVPDQRGRGKSPFAQADTYSPIIYSQDMWMLADHLGIEEFLVIGTSMGGIISLLMSAERTNRIKGYAFNDIGPELEQEALERILDYLGKDMDAANWDEAIEATKARHAINYPDFTDEQWLELVQRLYKEQDDQSLRLDYDEDIAIPVRSVNSAQVPIQMWSLYEMTTDVPFLVIRGAESSLFSAETLQKMKERHPQCVTIEVPNRGHTPVLDEPLAVTNIRSWMSRCNKKLM